MRLSERSLDCFRFRAVSCSLVQTWSKQDIDLMPQVKLTVRNAPSLPAPAEGFIEYFDLGLPGFGLRVSSKGRRTWIARYRIKGRKGKGSMSLGTVGGTEFADARGLAKDALRAAEKGIDPAEPIRKE